MNHLVLRVLKKPGDKHLIGRSRLAGDQCLNSLAGKPAPTGSGKA